MRSLAWIVLVGGCTGGGPETKDPASFAAEPTTPIVVPTSPTEPTPTDPATPTDTATEPTTEPLPLVVRVVTWNVESVGYPGSESWVATRDVLARIDADVIALNEIDYYEEDDLAALAADLGYPTLVVASTNPFGGLHNAVLTRLPVVSSTIWTSAALSADPEANDVTRWPVAVEVETGGGTLAVVSEHWKSGFDVIDEFRRVVDSVRVAQAADASTADGVVALGDLNAEIGEIGVVPTWFYVPVDAPESYTLGADLQAVLDGAGLPNDVFVPLVEAGLVRVDALQRDGSPATRDVSGRIIDHLFADGGVVVHGAEIYDARDEALPGLPLSGAAPEPEATATASDHLPVFVDLEIPL